MKKKLDIKTGYRNASLNPDVKDKKIKTCQENYGCDNPSLSDIIKLKKVDTCVSNFGVEYGYFINRTIAYNSISKLNKRIYMILDNTKILYEPEFKILYEKRYRSYDIHLLGTNILIEINGDFWHANPTKYKATDILNFPHIGNVLVEDIWKRDELKYNLVIENNFRVMYIWESQMNKMTDLQIVDLILEISNIKV